MKKISNRTHKIIVRALATLLVLQLSIIPATASKAISAAKAERLIAKSAWIGGTYVGTNRFSKESADRAVLTISEYTSFDEGSRVGNFSIRSYGGKVRPSNIPLYIVGKNKYRCKKADLFTVLTFYVKKNKIIVKQKGKIKTSRGYLSYAGTYKLKKLYQP